MGKIAKALAGFILKFDKDGRELPDPRPMEIPAGFKRPETLQEQIRRLIRTDVSAFAEDQGAESFWEANDFDTEDDDAELHPTHHELHEEVVDEVKRVKGETDAQRRAAGRAKDRKAEGEGLQEEADEPDSRADVPRSRKSQPRSAERRPTGRREHAESSGAEINPGRGNPNRGRYSEDDDD